MSLRDIAAAKAAQHGIAKELVFACVEVETSWEPERCRYESLYSYLVAPSQWAKRLGQTEITETIQQKTSWGLMQTMGGVARENGFNGYLTLLSDPEIGLEYGCVKLALCLKKYPDWLDAYAAYNGGSVRYTKDRKYVNQANVDKLVKALQNLGIPPERWTQEVKKDA